MMQVSETVGSAGVSGSANPYLSGNFGPVRAETDAVDLRVSGTIPPELDGWYVRNGPNPITDPDPASYNWFTGTGMIHGVRLASGRAAWYRNRYVRAGDVPHVLGEQDPGGAAPHGGMDRAANTNVIGHAGRIFAIVEAGALPVELDGELRTIGRCDFDTTLRNGFSAHPKLDPQTGELHAVCYFWGLGNHVQYVTVGRDGRVNKTVDVATHASPMLHDCAITETHVAVFDFPVAFDLELVQRGSRFPYRWFDEHPCRVGLLPREATDDASIRWFEIEPCYVYHPMNSYDDGDRVVINVSRHPKAFAKTAQPSSGLPTLWRWTFDRSTGRATETQLSDVGMEFPRVNETLTGRRHRLGYATPVERGGDTIIGSTTLKFDLVTGHVARFDHGPGRHPGELVFVPREGTTAEDDGYLIGFVHDDTTGSADLVILDAQHLDAAPLALVHLPVRVPFGFHGNWIPA